MENFKEKLRIQNLIIAVGSFVLAVFCLLFVAGEAGILPFPVPTASASSSWESFRLLRSSRILVFIGSFPSSPRPG